MKKLSFVDKSLVAFKTYEVKNVDSNNQKF